MLTFKCGFGQFCLMHATGIGAYSATLTASILTYNFQLQLLYVDFKAELNNLGNNTLMFLGAVSPSPRKFKHSFVQIVVDRHMFLADPSLVQLPGRSCPSAFCALSLSSRTWKICLRFRFSQRYWLLSEQSWQLGSTRQCSPLLYPRIELCLWDICGPLAPWLYWSFYNHRRQMPGPVFEQYLNIVSELPQVLCMTLVLRCNAARFTMIWTCTFFHHDKDCF